MDKVQFNQQKVALRKVVKQARVRVIHQLTRQIQRLQKKSGSAQQVEKNKRRAERLGAEIEAIKTFSPDQITIQAVESKKTLEDVCKKPNASAKERAMARITNYGLLRSKVAQFKDMVEPDFLEMGKKNKRKLKKERAEARFKKEDEEEEEKEKEEDGLEEDSKDGDSDESNDENSESVDEDRTGSEEEEEEEEEETEGQKSDTDPSSKTDLSKESISHTIKDPTKSKKSPHKRPVRTAPQAAVDQESLPSAKRKPKSSFFTTDDGGEDEEQDEGISSGDEKTTSGSLAKEFKGFSSELKTNESIKDFLKSRTAEGRKSLDSVFMGRLSEKKTLGTGKQPLWKKNRAGQRERLRKGKMNDPGNKKAPIAKSQEATKQPKPRRVAPVDQPNAVRTRSGEKLVPGVNCFRNKMYTGKDNPASKQEQKGEEKLHPSWEAKRRKKEQESKPVTFAGKKITFDED